MPRNDSYEGAIVTLPEGGRQRQISLRLDLLPQSAILRVSNVMAIAAEDYGENTWRSIPSREHLNHAMYHLMRAIGEGVFKPSDLEREEDLAHAACRVLFALETYQEHLRVTSPKPVARHATTAPEAQSGLV